MKKNILDFASNINVNIIIVAMINPEVASNDINYFSQFRTCLCDKVIIRLKEFLF